MNILLYSPTYFEGTVEMNYPYAIVALGTYLRREGYSVRLLDGSVEEDVCAKIKKLASWADVLGVSMTTFQIAPALRDIRIAKQVNPDIKVVAGGVHPTLMPEQTLAHPDIDYVIVYEGEVPLCRLIDAFENKNTLEDVPNLVYMKDGQVCKNPVLPFADMDKLPSMDWKMLENSTAEAIARKKEGVVLAGKGCNYNCTFCFNPIAKNKFRGRSAANILDDIGTLIDEYGVKNIYFRDENFFYRKDRLLEVAEGLLSRGYDIEWSALSRVSFLGGKSIDDDDMKILVKSGLRKIRFGAESGDQDVLNGIKKGIKVEQIYEAARMCARHGVKGSFSFMTGLPDEKWDEFMRTLDCIDKIREIMGDGCEILGPHAFFVYPSGEIYQRCIELGYRPPQSLEGWTKVKRNPITGLSEYYWKSNENGGYVENIALIRALKEISIEKVFSPPYSLRNVRNFFLIPVVLIERMRWRSRWFGLGLIEMRFIKFFKEILVCLKRKFFYNQKVCAS